MANILNKFLKTKNKVSEKPVDLRGANNNHSTRVSQDVLGWRQAIYEMESNSIKYRVKVNNIYNDVMLDGHVKSCISKRKNLSLLQDYALFDSNDNIDYQSTEIINKKWFRDIMNYILDAQFYGYNLINWTSPDMSDIQIINRELINPDGNFVGNYPYSTDGISLNDESIYNWSLYVSTPSQNGISVCGYGLLYEVANYQILSRNNLSNNADFSEKFAMPTTIYTTNKINSEDIDIIEESLLNLGSNGYLIKDNQDMIEHLEFSNSDNGYQVYDNLEKRLEAKISKLLLGHADALDSVPGKLGSSEGDNSPVVKSMMEIKSIDSSFITYYINDYLLPKLKNLGFKIKDGLVFNFINNNEKIISDTNLINRRKEISSYIKLLSESGITVDEKWLSDELGIPLKYSTTTENSDSLKKKVTNESSAFDSLIYRIWNGESIKYDFNLFKQISSSLDVFKNNEVKNDAFSERLNLVHSLMRADNVRFSFAKTQEEISKLNELYKKDLTYSDFREEALKINEQYNINYLKTEFDTAYNKMLNTDEYLDKSSRYRYATWRQINRITARDEHKYLNGKTFEISKLPLIPPIGYNCGCELEYMNQPIDLVDQSYIKSNKSEWQNIVRQGFDTNPALTGKIFGSGYDEYKKNISLSDQGFKISNTLLTMLNLNDDEIWKCRKNGKDWIIDKQKIDGTIKQSLNMTDELLNNIKNMIIYEL